MRCQHCVRRVHEALGAVAGVEVVRVDLDSGLARVRGRVDPAVLLAAVTALGYQAELS
ncbi:heavy-metal-associated domain-containing protein [Marichromatium bheemlicum]|uniref:Heavy-metal-associated domain-containing protein n=2 Tax=Marichromatium bheemlicum TaxID=365339 RepID=A0ABX1IBX0_9GAMM|nr:heavy-metal-associated domain-containing protein [Marichromatium bheemlicum]